MMIGYLEALAFHRLASYQISNSITGSRVKPLGYVFIPQAMKKNYRLAQSKS